MMAIHMTITALMYLGGGVLLAIVYILLKY